MVNLWIENNIKEIYKICKNVAKCTKDEYYDLCHTCIEQILINKNFYQLKTDNEKLYFFARVVRNNYNSRSSPYFYTFKKFNYCELEARHNVEDKPYQRDDCDLSWVETELKEMKKTNMWYYGRIFELYIEESCNLTKLSKRTTIPQNSLSRDINKVRKILLDKRNKTLNDGL